MAKRFYPEQGEEGAQKIADKLKVGALIKYIEGYIIRT